MTEAAGDTVALYGTEEPVDPPIVLCAGALTAELDAGNLQHIRLGPVEVIRAIPFIVRDRQWGTYNPTIDNLHVDERADGFTVSYRAEAKDERQSFTYRASIEGRSDRVPFAAEGASADTFETCRTGFVVLHPVKGVAGEPVTIEHVDGSLENGRFPDLIDPIQPMLDLRALTHEAAPGLKVTCRMEGDTFEMEDQRNWCDASYKTYVRPLPRPSPYRLTVGETVRQSVSLTIEGEAPPAASAGGPVRITLARRSGPHRPWASASIRQRPRRPAGCCRDLPNSIRIGWCATSIPAVATTGPPSKARWRSPRRLAPNPGARSWWPMSRDSRRRSRHSVRWCNRSFRRSGRCCCRLRPT